MRQILTRLIILLALLCPVFTIGSQASAVQIFNNTCDAGAAGSGSAVCKSVQGQQSNNDQNPIIKIIKGAIEVISFLVGIAAIIGLVVSGIRLITSSGDSNSVASARSGLIYSLVGIAVVALAQVIVVFVLGN